LRKQHNATEKAQMVLAVLEGSETLNEIAAHHNVHPTLLARWKTQAVKGLPLLFENENQKARKQTQENEREKEELYRQIGKLTTQLEWLKKKSGF
jgi:transposase-like protein